MKKHIRRIILKIYLLLKERKFRKRLKYIYINNHSDSLLVVFSGFPSGKPVYNYMRTLSNLKTISKLFILDDFGYKGSYYWFEKGKDYPLSLTTDLIKTVMGGGKFKRMVTMGTSKGGTCAIYYGLIFKASDIYSGACQYYVGNYLSIKEHLPILKAMLGENYSEEDVYQLNQMMPNILKVSEGQQSVVHLLYSKNEHTYQDHIVYLIDDLNKYHIPYTEQVENFNEHVAVGNFFIDYIKKEFKYE